MARLQLMALIESIPLDIKNSMSRAKKCSSPIPRCQLMQWSGFPCGIKSTEKDFFELWNRFSFSRPWKSMEFGQNVYTIL